MKLQENTCLKCGQPITTTRELTTQHWDLTPIPAADAPWVAFLRSPVLAITGRDTSWRAQLDRDHISLPTHHDRYQTWLAGHRCHHPPIPGARERIVLTAPSLEFDLFNQPDPAADLPPY